MTIAFRLQLFFLNPNHVEGGGERGGGEKTTTCDCEMIIFLIIISPVGKRLMLRAAVAARMSHTWNMKWHIVDQYFMKWYTVHLNYMCMSSITAFLSKLLYLPVSRKWLVSGGGGIRRFSTPLKNQGKKHFIQIFMHKNTSKYMNNIIYI